VLSTEIYSTYLLNGWIVYNRYSFNKQYK
jgi:hypothetical protein